MFSRAIRRPLFWLTLLPLSAPATALADDVLAEPCEAEPFYCMTAPIGFDHTDALPIEWFFDTGWVPPDPPLQVRLAAGVYAHTRVKLDGALQTEWPETLTLTAPGDPDGGLVGYHYGLEVLAQGRVSIEIMGTTYSWEGDIPFVPQVDFQVKNEVIFDAWGWHPGATATSSTEPIRLAEVGLADIIGPTIPGIDGGFELDVALDVSVTYVNDRIVVTTTEGQRVSGGDIVAADGETSAAFEGGPMVEFDVHPEGTVHYDGVLHLIPAFYVDLLGLHFSIPVADIPIEFPITTSEWVFEAQRVGVPLPDLVVIDERVDFGDVVVGSEQYGEYLVRNDGLAPVAMAISATDAEHFPLWDEALQLEPEQTINAALRFAPTEPRVYEAQLLIASNDPVQPMKMVTVTGRGVQSGVVLIAPDEAPLPAAADGGCGCRLDAPSPDARAHWLLGPLAGLLWWTRRRRH